MHFLPSAHIMIAFPRTRPPTPLRSLARCAPRLPDLSLLGPAAPGPAPPPPSRRAGPVLTGPDRARPDRVLRGGAGPGRAGRDRVGQGGAGVARTGVRAGVCACLRACKPHMPPPPPPTMTTIIKNNDNNIFIQ
jgi:hypothetical protein